MEFQTYRFMSTELAEENNEYRLFDSDGAVVLKQIFIVPIYPSWTRWRE